MLERLRLLLLFLVVIPLSVYGQIHGVPASVSSFGFGGHHSFAPGVPASVTSLGPNGFGGGHRFGNFNGFFQSRQSPGFFRGHRFRRNFFAGSLPFYSVPYTEVVVVQPDTYADDEDSEDYDGGPTVFDRRRSSTGRTRFVTVEPEREAPPQAAAAPVQPTPVIPQPSTVLVFRDGHQSELQNYAIVGDTIFDLGENRSHKIQVADLDLAATRKANDERGVDFQVPGYSGQ